MLTLFYLLKPDDSLFILTFHHTDSLASSLVNRHISHVFAKLTTHRTWRLASLFRHVELTETFLYDYLQQEGVATLGQACSIQIEPWRKIFPFRGRIIRSSYLRVQHANKSEGGVSSSSESEKQLKCRLRLSQVDSAVVDGGAVLKLQSWGV